MQDLNTQMQAREERLKQLYESFTSITDTVESRLHAKQAAEIQRQGAQDAMKAIEADIDQQILFATIEEVDAKNPEKVVTKQAFTNQAQRDNEKYRRLAEHQVHSDLRQVFEQKGVEIDQLRNELEVLSYRFKAVQAQSQLEALLPLHFTVTAQPQLQSKGNASTEKI